MSKVGRTQVLIVGAGPTGLTLACLLLQAGIDVRLIDKNPARSETSKAIGLQYRVSEILACMGVIDRFLESGASPTPINMYEGKRPLLRLCLDLFGQKSRREAFSPQPIIIPQSDTEAILGDLLKKRGGSIEWNREFRSYEQSDDCVRSSIRNGSGFVETIESDWLISCEGTHSNIRRQAGIAFRGKTYPLAFCLADVELEWPYTHQENHVWFHEKGSCAALPLPQADTWRLFFEISDEEETLANGVSLANVRQLLEERMQGERAHIRKALWLSEFRINCRMVDRFRDGRVFLAGDAAHIHSPTGGQGITTCLQDAVNLSWKLARVLKGASTELLDTYEEERFPHAEEVLRETDRTTTIFFSKSPWIRFFRDFAVLPVLKLTIVQRLMFEKLAQLHVNYRKSSLSQQDIAGWLARPKLRAGDRAPDVALHLVDSDQDTTLFQILTSFRPVVLFAPGLGDGSLTRAQGLLDALRKLDLEAFALLRDPAQPMNAPNPSVLDTYGDVYRVYGCTPGSLLLIRPDGHLGLVQKPLNQAALIDYLHKICDRRAVDGALGNVSQPVSNGPVGLG